MGQIVRVTTHEFRDGPDRLLVDVCEDAHGCVVEVRAKAKLQDHNPTYAPRWSPPWGKVDTRVETFYQEQTEPLDYPVEGHGV